jgi:hypothetical protein
MGTKAKTLSPGDRFSIDLIGPDREGAIEPSRATFDATVPAKGEEDCSLTPFCLPPSSTGAPVRPTGYRDGRRDHD